MEPASSDTRQAVHLHANCVALDGSGVLLIGASGTGKSALSLQLMSLGATLVSDDRTDITLKNGRLVAQAPHRLSGVIEARGVGLMFAQVAASAPVGLVVDLDRSEHERLPEAHSHSILGVDLPCLHKIEGSHFPAAILQYLSCGRRDPA